LTGTETSLEAELAEVEQILHKAVDCDDPLVGEVSRYLLRAGGKRLRPRLLLLAAWFGRRRPKRRTLHLAAAVELLHMATLLHDDVVDESPQRRGRPTVQVRWDTRTAVLGGDYLVAAAFELLAAWGGAEAWRGVATVIRAMAEGEMQEQACCGRADVTEQDYFERIEKKTALFIAECCRLGAVAAAADAGAQDALRRYGYHLGMAYQVIDDVLDLVGDRLAMGKPTGVDLGRRLATLPLIHCLRVHGGDAQRRVREVLANATVADAEVAQVVAILQDLGCIDYALEAARHFAAGARAALRALPDLPARAGLEEIVGYVVTRDR